MRNLLKAQWILVFNNLCLAIAGLLLYQHYGVFKTLLSEESLELWTDLSGILSTMFLLSLLSYLYFRLRKKTVNQLFAGLNIIANVLIIYWYYYHINRLIPSSIPNWMIPVNLEFYLGTFLLPAILYSLVVMVVRNNSDVQSAKGIRSILAAFLIPLGVYGFSLLVLPFFKYNLPERYAEHVVIISLMALTVLFIYLVIRGLYILSQKKKEQLSKYDLLWKIPFALIFPVVGLLFNAGKLEFSGPGMAGIFGNFSSVWFYVLAVLNGILICIPRLKKPEWALMVFLLRMAGLAYVSYFMLVFLPYLPLSIIVVIVFGLGFLMLSPLILFIIQILEISKDFEFLRSHYSKRQLRSLGFLSFSLIPFLLSLNYLQDRIILHRALEYVYYPDPEKEYDISMDKLEYTLAELRNHKDSRFNAFDNHRTPFLSSYYQWMVLDNLSLSEEKIQKLEYIFFNHPGFTSQGTQEGSEAIQITKSSVISHYDKKMHHWISQVELELHNGNSQNFMAEYATEFTLPPGTYISDYYLYVGDRKEKGILAEKRSALWLFNNIRNIRKDPGILYYTGGRDIGFRIFPFSADEIRKTGIEFVHLNPVRLEIDSLKLQLGNGPKDSLFTKDLSYIDADHKQKLQRVKREAYLHFLVDASAESDLEWAIQQIEWQCRKHPKLAENAKISIVNSSIQTFDLDEAWQNKVLSCVQKGGFFIRRALENSLRDNYLDGNNQFPYLLVVAKKLNPNHLNGNFKEWDFCYPDLEYFFHLDSVGKIRQYNLGAGLIHPDLLAGDFPELQEVYRYQKNQQQYFLNTKDEDALLLTNLEMEWPKLPKVPANRLMAGLVLDAKQRQHILFPNQDEKEWLEAVKRSFQSGVMSPNTSYLVVENDAQKAALLKKQKDVLAGNKYLDLDEDSQRMSEPGWYWYLLIMSLFFAWTYRKNKLKKQSLV